jgi:thioredoxin 2
MADQLKLVKVDVDQSPALAQRFEVQAIPTLLVMRDGQVVARQSGATPVEALRTWVRAAIQQSARS